MPQRPAILIITAGGDYAWVVANALASRFDGVEVALEQPESKRRFLKRRARKVGWLQTAGQFVTMAASRTAKRATRARTASIIADYGLQTTLSPSVPVTRISSANGADCLQLIAARKPDLVFLAGCRMLSAATLKAIPCPVLNYHSGLNPSYRGMACGWWARASGDIGQYGTTVHLVDAGVDTGPTLRKHCFPPDPRASLMTDALLMAAASREMVVRAAEDTLAGDLTPIPSDLPSVQRFHPPIWTYLWTGAVKGIW
ncbi:formyl transferase [Hoeflea olei]|uniref:phosphoribosylglycinamide formyltransferase 1 n=1 Tax=Hoeflea olei TaxID=1480615 RepID=A0A1C1YVN8_9HYPH|nr:formyl transferase [Hoeflea olei]OCW57593.1 formyl transferase [Hoeflea olei]